MKVFVASLWPHAKGGRYSKEPSTIADALSRYRDALAAIDRYKDQDPVGAGGCTFFPDSPRLKCAVRGVDVFGNPAMYFIFEGEEEDEGEAPDRGIGASGREEILEEIESGRKGY